MQALEEAIRDTRAQLAKNTVAIIQRGWYETPAGGRVDLAQSMHRCLASTILYRPDEPDQLMNRIERPSTGCPTRFEIVNETSLSAAHRLVARHGSSATLCLNFASAKNPGGGFLGGSQAQEESLARSSGLYASLLFQGAYYEVNRACRTALYTDHMILSPQVPVFRDDSGTLLDEPYELEILTAPAVNAGAIRKNEPDKEPLILPTMAARIEKVLIVAAQNNFEHLVLGAWGCGVFCNDPTEIASLFAAVLRTEGRFHNRFRTVAFAVLDGTPEERIIAPFRKHFSERFDR